MTVVLDAELAERMEEFVYAARSTLSAFVQDAVAVRLARVDTPGEYVAAKRAREERKPQSVFDLTKCHESGYPKHVPASFWQPNPRPDDEIRNWKMMVLHSGSSAKAFGSRVWVASGLGEYGDREWAATCAWAGRSPTIAEDTGPVVNLGNMVSDAEANALDEQLRQQGWQIP